MAKKKSNNPLIVHELFVKNVGPLKEVHIVPKGDVVELTGPNGAGKSYILDSISFALSGANSFKDIPEVTRNGEGDAEIVVDLGDYKVVRNWTDEEHYYLKVVAKMDGEEFDVKSPQSLLDTFGQTIGVDPLELADKKNTQDRKDFLESLVDVDLDALEEERKEIYSKRRDVGRDNKKAQAQLDGMEEPPEDLPEPVDTQEVMEKLEAAQKRNSNRERAEEKLEEWKESLETGKKKLEEHEDEIAILEEGKEKAPKWIKENLGPISESVIQAVGQKVNSTVSNLKAARDSVKENIEYVKNKISETESWLEDNPEKDVEGLKEKLNNAQEIQETLSQADAYQKTAQEVQSTQEKYDELTQEIEALDQKKQEAIQSAEMPMEGMDLTEQDVTIDGQAFSQYSEGERLKYAALMLIGSDPKFKVIGVKEGEKLDSKNRKILEQVAQEHGFQLWIERMDESGDHGYVLKSGEVVKNNQKD